MADIRIKDLTSTASTSTSDDFLPIDGLTNGTKKLSAYSPTFGGNATVGGTLTVSGAGSSTVAGTLVVNPLYAASQKLEVQIPHTVSTENYLRVASNNGVSTYGGEYGYGLTSGGSPEIRINRVHAATSTNVFTIPTSSGNVTISTTTDSTTKDTGCLVLEGGLGVEKNATIGATLFFGSSADVQTSRAGAGVLDVRHPSNTTSRLDVTGATSAGIGFRQSGTRDWFVTAQSNELQTSCLTAASIASYESGVLVRVRDTTASTSTSSGALVVGNGTSGGLGVGGAITLGSSLTSTASDGKIVISGSGNTTGTKELQFVRADGGDSTVLGLAGSAYAGVLTGLGNNDAYLYTSSAYAFRIFVGTSSRFDFTSSQFKINPTTASTSTITGALVVSGGVGVAGAIYAGGDIHSVGTNAALTVWKDGTPTKAAQLMFGALGDNGVGIRIYDGSAWSTAVNVGPLGTLTANASSNAFRIATAQTPASAAATGTAGTICWDTSYVYVCTATNTWKRAAISTW